MAQALARGIAENPSTRGWSIAFHDPSPAAAESFQKSVPQARLCQDNQAVCQSSELVLLAVKPQLVADVLPRLATDLADRLVLSVVAGLKLERLASMIGHHRIVRAMPNTPALVGEGATAFAPGSKCSAADRALVASALGAVGWAAEVPERMLDAVTGLSGSGPAYVMLIIEGLADGGVRMGLPRDIAHQLAVRTVLGSARLVEQTGEHPAILREQVTSPGGTTAAGLAALEQGAVRYHLQAAVEAAARRAFELGQSES